MDLVTYAGIFLLGAAATAIILRLLFLFFKRPSKANLDDQYLKRIASALQ